MISVGSQVQVLSGPPIFFCPKGRKQTEETLKQKQASNLTSARERDFKQDPEVARPPDHLARVKMGRKTTNTFEKHF